MNASVLHHDLKQHILHMEGESPIFAAHLGFNVSFLCSESSLHRIILETVYDINILLTFSYINLDSMCAYQNNEALG